MTCVPYAGEASVFNSKHTISTVYNSLLKKGLFLVSSKCYFNGDGKDVREDVEKVFKFIGNIKNNEGYTFDVWQKV